VSDSLNAILKQVHDSARVLVVALDPDGGVVEFNPYAETVTGWTRNEVVGRDWLTRFIPSEWHERFAPVLTGHPDDRIFGRVETQIRTRDGALRWIEWSSSLLRERNWVVLSGIDVTEQKNSLAELGRSVKEISIVAITDRKGMITYVNDRFCEISGYSRDELIGQDHRLVNSGYHSREFFKDLWSTLHSGRVWKGQFRNRAKDGSYYWVDTTIVPFLDEDGQPYQFVAIRTEITERIQAELALAEQKERLAVTLSSIRDAVITTDVLGRVVLMNPVAQQLTGWRAQDAAGRMLGEVCHLLDPRKREPVDGPVARVLDTGLLSTGSTRAVLISRDGTETQVEESSAPLRDPKSELVGVVIVFRDITDRIKSEEEMFKASKLESLGVLAGGIAHDFNNILASILMNLSIVRMDIPQEGETISILSDAETACQGRGPGEEGGVPESIGGRAGGICTAGLQCLLRTDVR
jgi:PAS domain S-box-containing protein